MEQRKQGRRSLVKGIGVAAATVAIGGGRAEAQAAAAAASTFVPARHTQDEWLDKLPGKHRVILDVTSASGVPEAIGFAGNLYSGNKTGYGIEEGDLAIIICLRHSATLFGFSDAIWLKHGKAMADAVKYSDPKATEPPKANPFNVAPRSAFDGLTKRGLQFMVCDTASHRFARMLAGADGDAEAKYKEMAANMIPSSRFVAAGVIGVTRAQEFGYSVVHVG
jgi:intracellular sulfur oxidation DsrE/DsrF family protein